MKDTFTPTVISPIFKETEPVTIALAKSLLKLFQKHKILVATDSTITFIYGNKSHKVKVTDAIFDLLLLEKDITQEEKDWVKQLKDSYIVNDPNE